MPSSVELLGRNARRRARQRVGATRHLREGDDLANVRLAREQSDEAIEPEGEATVWRSAHLQCLEQEAELLTSLVLGQTESAKDALLDVLAMDSDRSRTELPAVPDEVVCLTERRARIALDQLFVPGRDPGERVMAERPAPGLLVELEEREVDDPEKLVTRLVHEAQLLAEVQPQKAENPRCGTRLVGDEEDGRARRRPEGVELRFGEELRDGRANVAVLGVHEICEPLRSPFLRRALEAFELGARERLRRDDVPHRRRVREDAESRVACQLCRVVYLELEAQVRLVGSETAHRLVPRDPGKRRFRRLASECLEGAAYRLLEHVQHLLAFRVRQLDVELAELELAVRAQILVSEAGGDLVVALEARDHEQLLEQLWRLREREEVAGL